MVIVITMKFFLQQTKNANTWLLLTVWDIFIYLLTYFMVFLILQKFTCRKKLYIDVAVHSDFKIY
jgi:hypothetical protein